MRCIRKYISSFVIRHEAGRAALLSKIRDANPALTLKQDACHLHVRYSWSSAPLRPETQSMQQNLFQGSSTCSPIHWSASILERVK